MTAFLFPPPYLPAYVLSRTSSYFSRTPLCCLCFEHPGHACFKLRSVSAVVRFPGLKSRSDCWLPPLALRSPACLGFGTAGSCGGSFGFCSFLSPCAHPFRLGALNFSLPGPPGPSAEPGCGLWNCCSTRCVGCHRSGTQVMGILALTVS